MATATLAPPTLLTIEQYLQNAYHPDREFIDGHLEDCPMGEREHSILQIALGAWFFNHRSEWGIVVMSEQRTRVSPTRVRLPDLCLVAADAPPDRVTIVPPLLAIEFLSPKIAFTPCSSASTTSSTWASRTSGSSTRSSAPPSPTPPPASASSTPPN